MEDDDPVIEALVQAINKRRGLQLVTVVCVQADPLLVSINGVGSVPATQQGTTLVEGDVAYALWAPPRMPVVFGGSGGGGGVQGLFGNGVTQTGAFSNAGGTNSDATGNYSLAVGDFARAEGEGSVAFNAARASGTDSLAEGEAYAQGFGSHAEGQGGTGVDAEYAHAEGGGTALAIYAHAEGNGSATQESAHAEGVLTTSSGLGSHAEGRSTTASAEAAHSEGSFSTASGDFAHSEGNHTKALGIAAHSEGAYSEAPGDSAHAEGDFSQAIGVGSHSQGTDTMAIGQYTDAAGWSCIAFRDLEVSNGAPFGDRTLQRTHIPLSGNWNGGTAGVDLNYGTDPVTIPIHNGYFEGTVTLYSADLADKWVIQFYGHNDATTWATRGAGTVTIISQSGGGATIYGASAITWTVSGDSSGNVLITPSGSIGGSDLKGRAGSLDLMELHEYSIVP